MFEDLTTISRQGQKSEHGVIVSTPTSSRSSPQGNIITYILQKEPYSEPKSRRLRKNIHPALPLEQIVSVLRPGDPVNSKCHEIDVVASQAQQKGVVM